MLVSHTSVLAKKCNIEDFQGDFHIRVFQTKLFPTPYLKEQWNELSNAVNRTWNPYCATKNTVGFRPITVFR